MAARTMHIGFDVQGCIRLLEDIPYPKRDLKWGDMRDELAELKKQGIKVYSLCPTPKEVELGVFKCPGHPKS